MVSRQRYNYNFSSGLCSKHYLKNELYCFEDREEICAKCVPSHLGHRMEHMAYLGFNKDKIERPLMNSNKFAPPNRNFDYNRPKYDYKDQYVAVNKNKLWEIESSYWAIKGQIGEMLDREINQINFIIDNKNIPRGRNIAPSGRFQESRSVNLPARNNNQDPISPIAPIKIINNQIPNSSFSNQNQNQNQRALTPLKRSSPSGSNIRRSLNGEFDLVLKIDNDQNSLYLFDIGTLDGRKVNIPNYIIPPDSALIKVQGRVMISGGSNETNAQLSLCYFIDLETFTTINCSSMNADKRSHTLSKVNDYFVYSIGGYNSSRDYLNLVERYSMRDDNWNPTSSLSIGRQDISCCSFNNQYLYCFGGAVYENNIWNFMSNIERLNTSNENMGWELIQVGANDGWTPRGFVGLRQISSREIMIFGGYDSNHLNDVLIFNTEDKSIFRTNILLRRRSSFIQRNSTMMEDESNIYSVGFPHFDVHRYSFSNKLWEYLDETQWFTF